MRRKADRLLKGRKIENVKVLNNYLYDLNLFIEKLVNFIKYKGLEDFKLLISNSDISFYKKSIIKIVY